MILAFVAHEEDWEGFNTLQFLKYNRIKQLMFSVKVILNIIIIIIIIIINYLGMKALMLLSNTKCMI